MKKLVEIAEGEGLDGLLGQVVILFCVNYFYTGTLTGVNAECVLLTNPAVVFETGPFTDTAWKDAQSLPKPIYVMKASIEAFGEAK